jgi:hypothetical protein
MTKRAQSTSPILVDESDLSRAWAKAMLHVLDHPGLEISPLILSVSGFDEDGGVVETPAVRTALDALLLAKEMRSVEDVAFTIFPQRIWQVAQGNRGDLFKYYRDAFPISSNEQEGQSTRIVLRASC